MGLGVIDATPAPESLRLAGHHFTTATCFLLAGSIGLVWIAPQLAQGQYLSPHVAGVTHLFTLGWITIAIFGALCQFLPVALGVPIRSPRAAHIALILLAPGVALFAAGVITSANAVRLAGLVLVAAGILTMATNLYLSLAASDRRDPTWAGVTIGLTFLVSTLVFGIILVHNLETGFVARSRLLILASHMHLALIGWVLVMITGVSHRLMPMFMLAHGGTNRWTARALTAFALGVPVLIVGLLLEVVLIRWIGAALLLSGLGMFATQVRAFHKVRMKRKLDSGLKFAMTAVGYMLVAAILGVAVLFAGMRHNRLATSYITVGLLGGLVMYVVGFYYKIVPLLAWTWRYRGQMGRQKVPTVAQMFSARLAEVQLALMAGGVALIGTGIGFGLAVAVRLGALLFAGGTIVFASQLARVAVGQPLPAKIPQPEPNR